MTNEDRDKLLDITASQLINIREAANAGLRALSILKGDTDGEEGDEVLNTFGGGISNGTPEDKIKKRRG